VVEPLPSGSSKAVRNASGAFRTTFVSMVRRLPEVSSDGPPIRGSSRPLAARTASRISSASSRRRLCLQSRRASGSLRGPTEGPRSASLAAIATASACARARLRASVGSTEASASLPARVGVVGRSKPARRRRYRRYGSTPSIRSALTGPSVSRPSPHHRRDARSRQIGVTGSTDYPGSGTADGRKQPAEVRCAGKRCQTMGPVGRSMSVVSSPARRIESPAAGPGPLDEARLARSLNCPER
jgi:hypothetical protein